MKGSRISNNANARDVRIEVYDVEHDVKIVDTEEKATEDGLGYNGRRELDKLIGEKVEAVNEKSA